MIKEVFSNLKYVLFSFVLTFSLVSIVGCSDVSSGGTSSFGSAFVGNFDVKSKETLEMKTYLNYDTNDVLAYGARTNTNSQVSDKTNVTGVSSASSDNSVTSEDLKYNEPKNSQAKKDARQEVNSNKELNGTTQLRKNVIAYALQYLGNPYKYGGTSLTKGCDCSGFTMRVFEHFGITIPRTSTSQRGSGKSVSKPKPGDIICYSGHVNIYLGDGKAIGASTSTQPYPKGQIKIYDKYDYRSIITIRDVLSSKEKSK